MVKHVVCFKLTDGSQKNCELAREVLMSMDGKVETVKGITVNIDELRTPRSYYVMLEVLVDSYEALEVYQQDPYHCNVVKKHMHAVAASSIALDFTC